MGLERSYMRPEYSKAREAYRQAKDELAEAQHDIDALESITAKTGFHSSEVTGRWNESFEDLKAYVRLNRMMRLAEAQNRFGIAEAALDALRRPPAKSRVHYDAQIAAQVSVDQALLTRFAVYQKQHGITKSEVIRRALIALLGA